MPARGGRDTSLEDGRTTSYHDDETSPLSSGATARDDALSFLAIDGEHPDEDTTMSAGYLQKKRAWLRTPAIPEVHPGVKRAGRAVVSWCKGPDPPRPWRITPIFERVQTAPIRLLDYLCPKKTHKALAYILFVICWILTFSLVLWKSSFAEDVPGYGAPANIGCGARFWDKGNACGLNGDSCRPFADSTFTFRCPASCNKHLILENYPVGNESINYMPLIIGGPPQGSDNISEGVYRGDSFICASAVHAGYIKDEEGGCGVVKLLGEQANFTSSYRHHMQSIEFNSYFPLSFRFIDGAASKCEDLRWPLLAISVVYSSLLSLFCTSPAVLFSTLFLALFAHVGLVSDPPGNADYRQLVSTMLARLLPAAFVAALLYITTVKNTLMGLRAQVEKTVLWLGTFWVGCLNNYTFDRIPIQRLTPHDIQQQPGAIPALIIIVLTIVGAALTQAWTIRIEGKMPKYLAIYGAMGGTLLLLLAIPQMNLRIHHYLLALLLLPGTFPQTRPSLLFQGLLLGLFINGVARWGFASILQTAAELRNDAATGTKLPQILPPIVNNNFGTRMAPNITFEWEQPPRGFGYDGISILVNEVERLRTYEDQGMKSFTWTRHRKDLPEYFRFAFMSGSATGDYTKAGTWDIDGGWIEMQPGPSK